MLLKQMDPDCLDPSELGLFGNKFSGSFRRRLKEFQRFPEHSRKYATGDPISAIDWKVFGKTEQLIVRQIEATSSSHVRVVVDRRDSMHWPSGEEKFQTSLKMAKALLNAHLKAGDKVYIGFLGSSNRLDLAHIKSRQDLFKRELTDLATGDKREKFDLSYFVSDYINPVNPIFLESKNHMIHIQLLSSKELDLDWMGSLDYLYDDILEKKEVSAKELKDGYLAKFDLWRKQVQTKIKQSDSPYIEVSDNNTVVAFKALLERAYLEL